MKSGQEQYRSLSRRRFLRQTAALGAVVLLPSPAVAASIAKMRGEVLVNGKRATRETAIKAGDTVKTGAGAMVMFTLGTDAFLLRQMASLVLEAEMNSLLISGLRIITGAVLAVFGPGMRAMMTGFVTASIRGTGVYVEADAERTYFCTCYGNVGLKAVDGTTKDVITSNHSAHYISGEAGRSIVATTMQHHNNRELAALEKLVGRKPRLLI